MTYHNPQRVPAGPVDLLSFDPFADDKDDGGSRCSTKRVVTTRKEHECRWTAEDMHTMSKGTRAVMYQCIMHGMWCRFYLCAQHITEWLEEWV